MLITITSLILFVIFLISAIVCTVIEYNSAHYSIPKWLIGTLWLLTMVLFFVIFGCGLCVLITQVNKQIDYEKALYEKQVLEYRLENCEDLQGNELLYADITAFNNKLRNTKYWANNLWTSWFYNDKVVTIDYIEIGDFSTQGD